MIETPDLRAGFAPDSVVFQIQGQQLRLRFSGSNAGTMLEGDAPLQGQASFFNGSDPSGWQTGLRTYGRLLYRNLYPGIDLHYADAGGRLKSEFAVAPGADPSRIHLEYPDASVSIRADGSLLVSSGAAQLTEDAPVAYQDQPVPVRYVLIDEHTLRFDTGAYGRSRPPPSR